MRFQHVRIYFIVPFILLAFAGCKDEIDLENISSDFYYGGGWQIPGIQGTFTTTNLFNPETDSNFVFYGNDSIVLTVRRDSAFRFQLNDFLNSEQTLSQVLNGFNMPPQTLVNPYGTVANFPNDTYFPNVDSTTFYPSFLVAQNVEIDSMLVNSGSVEVDVTSTFEPNIWLTYKSRSIFLEDGSPLYDSILITEDGTYSIPLDGMTIRFSQSGTEPTDSLYFGITYALSIDIQAGESIQSDDQVELEVSSQGLDDYEYIFGYFGHLIVKEFNELDTFSLNLPELMDKLDGVFNFNNSRVNFYYSNSFGFDQEFEIGMRATRDDGSKDSAIFRPPVILAKPDQYDDRIRNDSTTMSADSINNILGEFPPPSMFSAAGKITINPDGKEVNNGYVNFVRQNSHLNVDLELEIPMEFGAELAYADTVPVEDFINIPKEGEHIEYARLHYVFENGFPLGLDVNLIMQDTVNMQNIDTIQFNATDDFFIEGGSVNANGIVEEVNSKTGMLEITHEEIYNLVNNTNKVIINILLITTGDDANDPVKLQPSNSLYYRFGVEFKVDGVISL